MIKRFTLLWFLIFYTLFSMAQADTLAIYRIESGDSTLSPQFVEALCEAARNKTGAGVPGQPSELEQLINKAAGTTYKAPDQPENSLRWHRKFGDQCYCEATEDFPAGGVLRQVVHSNFREFANLVGPRNRLSLDLSLKDPHDGLTIFEYIDKVRMDIEASYDNDRFEFQQDEAWRKIMFFYFLFSEYRVN